jgi:hypothetical protein
MVFGKFHSLSESHRSGKLTNGLINFCAGHETPIVIFQEPNIKTEHALPHGKLDFYCVGL